MALLALLGVALGPAEQPVSAQTAPAAQLAITKVANVADPTKVPVGTPFSFTIQYSCSSLTTPCINATLTDVIPTPLAYISNTSPSQPANVAYDAGTHTLTVTFAQNVGSGQVGLLPGTTGSIDVVTQFPAGTLNGVRATNPATLAADNADSVSAQATVTSFVAPVRDVGATKAFSPTTGVQQSGATTKVTLDANVLGNTGADSVVLTDPTDATTPFDSFDFQSFEPLNLPAGVTAAVEVTTDGTTYVTLPGGPYANGDTPSLSGSGVAAAQVVGLRATFTQTGGTIASGTSLPIAFDLSLRDTLRSDPATAVPPGVISNCTTVTGTYSGQPDVTHGQECATYTVVGQTPAADGSKLFSPATAVQQSGATTTLTLNGVNASNTPANQVVVTDPTDGAAPFDSFDFQSFSPLSLPAGVTAAVAVTTDGSTFVTLPSGPYGDGDTPSLSGSGVTAGQVVGLQFTYSGTIPAGQTLSANVVLALRDSLRSNPAIPVSGTVKNCESVNVFTDSGNATADNLCANFTVANLVQTLSGAKTFSPTSGVAGTGPQTVVTLTGGNSASSNTDLSTIVLTDPGATSDPTFDSFDFVAFQPLTANSGVSVAVEVFDGSTYVTLPGGPYSNGDTPTLAGSGVSAGSVQGVRVTATGTFAPGDNVTVPFELALRNTRRSDGTTIGGGTTITNRVDVTSPGVPTVVAPASYTTVAVNPGVPGIAKTFTNNPAVAGQGGVTTVTLKGTNNANVPVNSIVVVDPSTGSTFFDSLDFQNFTQPSLPAGITVTVEVTTDGTTWVTLPGGPYADGDTPSLSGSGVSASDVIGVRFTFSGTVDPGGAVAASFQAQVRDTLRSSGAPITGPSSVQNCASITTSGSFTDPVSSETCPTFEIDAIQRTVTQTKTFTPGDGVIGSSPTTKMTLETKNASNVGLDQIQVTEPSNGTTPFEQLDFVSFTALTLPANVGVEVEVNDGASWTALNGGTPYTNGQTSSLSGSGISAGDVVGIRLTYTSTNGQSIPVGADLKVGANLALRTTLRTSGNPVVPGPVQNCFATTSQPTADTINGNPCATYTIDSRNPGAAVNKVWQPPSGNRDQLPASTLTLTGRNSGNIPADTLVLSDPAVVGVNPLAANAFDALTLTGLGSLTLPTGADEVRLDVLTAGGFVNGSFAASLPSINALPGGTPAADVIGVRLTFAKSGGGTLPANGSDASLSLQVQLRSTLRSTGQPIPLGPLSNCATASVTSDSGNPTTPQLCATYTVNAGSLTLVPDKTLDPPGFSSFNPGDFPVFKLQLENSGTQNWTSPVVTDLLPGLLSYDQIDPSHAFTYTSNGSTLSATPTLSVLPNYSGGSTLLRWTWGPSDILGPGQTAYLEVPLQIAAGTPAATQITNTYGISQAGGGFTCSPVGTTQSDTNDLVNGQPGQQLCVDAQTVTVQQSRGLSALKEVKGSPDAGGPTDTVTPPGPCPDDSGYTYYPCVAHTIAGGAVDYQVTVQNIGNVPMEHTFLIDKLPKIGDTGVIVNQARDSQWRPILTGPVTVGSLPAGAIPVVYYSTVANPCTAPLTGGSWCGDWSTTDPGAATTAIGVDITFPNTKLNPAGQFQLSWPMFIPPDSPADGQIAWNSFAYTGKPTDQTSLLLPAEPRKVGIVLDTQVSVQKATVPSDASGTFTVSLISVDPTPPVADPVTRTINTAADPTGAPWTGLTPGGTYQLVETPTSGWVQTGLTCVDQRNGNAPVPTTPVVNGVQFVAPAGGSVVCDLTNTNPFDVAAEAAAARSGTAPNFTG